MLILQKAEKEASDKEKQNAEENGRCFYCKCAYQTKEQIFCVRCGRKNKTVRGGLEWKEVVNYLKESHAVFLLIHCSINSILINLES